MSFAVGALLVRVLLRLFYASTEGCNSRTILQKLLQCSSSHVRAPSCACDYVSGDMPVNTVPLDALDTTHRTPPPVFHSVCCTRSPEDKV